MDPPFWLGDFVIDDSTRRWVDQFFAHNLKDTTTDTFLDNHDSKLGPV